MTIDADGAPRAYHPPLKGRPSGSPPGLDDVRHPGSPGNWFGVATDAHRHPVIQRRGQPAPGFFVSATSLVTRGNLRTDDPRRYIDASTIPYIVLPPSAMHAGHARLGDIAAVFNRRNERIAFGIFADVGPKLQIGEGSIALAKALALPADPKAGGVSERIILDVVFPGSGNGFGRPVRAIDRLGARLLREWGGVTRLRKNRP